ncbi:penicillin-binding protein 1A [Acidocella sp.]|uniref:penicillin-binding protein 1A n=1 Tax=Acidocella sp. TaxID=50710 RepID=UPI003D078E49
MSDQNDDFPAGERLARSSRTPQQKRQPAREPRAPRPKRRGLIGRIFGFFITSLYRLAFLAVVAGIVIAGGCFLYFSAGLPSIDSLKTYKPPLETRVFTSNFQLLSEMGTQHSIYVTYDQIPPVVANAFISAEDRLFWVEPGINPLAVIRAGLTDIARIGSGRRPLGASTITQQVVKNMLLDNHITFVTKIKEAILAMRVSQAMSKQQVLTLYLNEVDLGHNSFGVAAAAMTYFNKPLSQLDIAQAATLAALPKAPTNYDPFLHPDASLQRRNFIIGRMQADGVITAAQAKTAQAEPLLPQAETATKGVPNGGYFADAVRAQLIQQFGLKAVNTGGLIVRTSLNPALQEAATNALRNGLESYDHDYDGWHGLVNHLSDKDLSSNWQALLAKQPTPAGMRTGWRLGIVLSAGATEARIGTTAGSNGTPETGTLPLANMRWARPRVNGHPGARPTSTAQVLHPGDLIMVSGDLKSLSLEQIPNVQGALISMDPRTGRVVAMVGGWSHSLSPFNRAVQAQRQPGSSVKPLVYLTAMEQGIQPDAPVLDGPFVQVMSNGTVYRPGNYENTFQGPVPVFHALEQSLNLATLHLARQVGLPAIAKTFHDFGIVDKMPPYYPSVIGAIDTTLWKMTAAYASLDQYGRLVTPSLIDSVTNPDGTVLYQAPDEQCANCVNGNPDQPPQLNPTGPQVADPDSVYQMLVMMRGVVLRGTGVPAVRGISQPVAGKTGTTNNFNDAWFIGFTPGIVTGCWVGFDTPTSLGNNETGGNVCGPIWNEYMKVALKNQPDIDFATPPGMTLQQVPEPDGRLVTEAFKPNQSPGAQNGNGLLGGGMDSLDGSDSSNPLTAPDNNGAPAPGSSAPAPAATIDKSLGGLY